jgi:hypothetical protein
VAPAATPAAAPAGEPPKSKRSSKGGFGLGFQYVEVAPVKPSSLLAARQVGLSLDIIGATPIAGPVDFGTRFSWGLTDWERAGRWASAGVAVGKWTNGAYVSAYKFTRKHGVRGTSSPDTHGLRMMGGGIAMGFLWLGYVIAGVAFVGAVVAPTTVLEVDFTGNFVLSEGDVSPYLKAGVGLMAFWHPEHHNLVGGIGPNVGAGIRVGPLHVGAAGTWSPPGLHGEFRDGHSHLFTGALTVGLHR